MNRLEAPSFPAESAWLSSIATSDSAEFSPQMAAGSLGQRPEWSVALPPIETFAPIHYQPGYAYPLVVWLHGAGQSERDLTEVMPHVSTRNYVGVAPRSPQAEGGVGGPWRQTPDAIQAAEETVFAAIETACDLYNIHSDRVFVAGVGEGGAAALRLALSRPDRFAGAATFEGPAPTSHALLRQFGAVHGLPVLLASSSQSTSYPQSQVCRDLRLFYTAGCSVKVCQEIGEGELTTSMLAEFDRWLMRIVCGDQSLVS